MKMLIERGGVVAACPVGRRTHVESRNNDAIHRLHYLLEFYVDRFDTLDNKKRNSFQMTLFHGNGIAINLQGGIIGKNPPRK
jgi:hypothetical protein